MIYSIWWFVWRKPNQQPTQNVIFFLKLFWLIRTPHTPTHNQQQHVFFVLLTRFLLNILSFPSSFNILIIFSRFWFHFNTRVNFFFLDLLCDLFFVVVVETAVLLTFHMGFSSIPAFDCSHTFNWITLLYLICKFNRYVYYLCLIVYTILCSFLSPSFFPCSISFHHNKHLKPWNFKWRFTAMLTE